MQNKYLREIKPQVYVDVYDVLLAFKVADPMLQHIIKKALAAGQRGHKDFEQDIKDIYDSAIRAYNIHCVKVQTILIDEEKIL
jgi:hypothetical protein